MLASLPPKTERLTLSEAHKFALRQAAHRCAPELARRTPRRLLPPIDAVAKHLRYYFGSAKKMDLKTVRLLLRARFCVNTADVRFRIGVGTSSHKKQLS